MSETSKIDDGGPAFPIPSVGTGDPRDGMTTGNEGMSLRDWFAGQALSGLSASQGTPWSRANIELMTDQCVLAADTLIRKLKAKNQ